MAATQDNMTCAVCREVYVSPRFLPCHHTFCLECLEELAKRHGDTIPCPTCRAPATVPPGGVCDLQVNFYFTEEALEQARSEKRQSMCPVHTKEVAIFHCTQCDQVICLKCKLTKHEGHATEELSDTIARSKKMLKDKLNSVMNAIKSGKKQLDSCKLNLKRAQEKRATLHEQIQVRYDVIVAMAGKCRDEALQELQTTCDDVEKGLSADTQRVQDELNSLLQLQARAQHALSSTCGTEVLDLEREMRGREIRYTPLVLSDQTYRPVLHGDFHTYTEDHYMKTLIGSPVKQSFQSKKTVDINRVGRCGDGVCREVHALRQREDGRIDVYYGGTGGDYSKEKGVCFNSDGFRGTEKDYGMRISCVTRKTNYWSWKDSTSCNLGSKNNSMHSLEQNFQTRLSYIYSMKWEKKDGIETCSLGPTLSRPKVNRAHNFDSNDQGTFFAVVDEEEDKNSYDESMTTNNSKADSRRSRVVRLYSNKKNDPIPTSRRVRYVTFICDSCENPIATYNSPVQPFFPTDVCFYGNDVLLIADWMNDCVHVTRVSDRDIEFVGYLLGSGDMVRPTALNLDLNRQLLIGCGDGWVLRVPVDYQEKGPVSPFSLRTPFDDYDQS